MNILYISQYFPPEIGATQVRAKENVLHLRELGYSVTVLTEMPNHPQGIIRETYRGKWVAREKWRGISILRVWVFTRPEKNFITRTLFYLSFMIMGILCGSFFLRQRYHIVYATSPPFFVGLLGWYLSKLRNGKFVFEVRDLWPQSAIELGELRNQKIIQLTEKLEMFYYRKAAVIVAVTRGIYNTIAKRFGTKKVLFLPNGANTNMFRPNQPIPPELKHEFNHQFVVIYAGLIGLIHGVETVIETAKLLQEVPNIRFLIIGDGVKKKEMEQSVLQYKLENVQFMDALQEESLVPYILLSQAALATAKNLSITRGTLPVKMFSAMACSKPVVLGIEGEGAELLKSANAGIVVQPDSPKDMAEAVLKLYRNPNLVQKLGENGRQFVVRHYDRKKLAVRLYQKLNEVAGNV